MTCCSSLQYSQSILFILGEIYICLYLSLNMKHTFKMKQWFEGLLLPVFQKQNKTLYSSYLSNNVMFGWWWGPNNGNSFQKLSSTFDKTKATDKFENSKMCGGLTQRLQILMNCTCTSIHYFLSAIKLLFSVSANRQAALIKTHKLLIGHDAYHVKF